VLLFGALPLIEGVLLRAALFFSGYLDGALATLGSGNLGCLSEAITSVPPGTEADGNEEQHQTVSRTNDGSDNDKGHQQEQQPAEERVNGPLLPP
jgi:hypothetical protein